MAIAPALAKAVAKKNGLYFSHIRGEAATLETALEEAIRIGETAGIMAQEHGVTRAMQDEWAIQSHRRARNGCT